MENQMSRPLDSFHKLYDKTNACLPLVVKLSGITLRHSFQLLGSSPSARFRNRGKP